MSKLAAAKMKAVHGNVKEAFRNQDGAIDLASIMVGIIVIGLIGGVIAATVFAVIPWAQDNAAKQQLDAVYQAENVYAGFSASDNLKSASLAQTTNSVVLADGEQLTSFGTAFELNEEGLFDADAADVDIAVADVNNSTGATNDHRFVAVKQSASGKWFFVSNSFSNARELLNGSGAAPGSAEEALSEAVSSINASNSGDGDWHRSDVTGDGTRVDVYPASPSAPPAWVGDFPIFSQGGSFTRGSSSMDARTDQLIADVPNVTWSLAPGSTLPQNFTLNSSTGVITGYYDRNFGGHESQIRATAPDGKISTYTYGFFIIE